MTPAGHDPGNSGGGWWRAARIARRDPRGDVDEELRFHLEMRARELIDAGLTPEAAWAEAERRFGAIPPIRDSCIRIDRRQRRRTLRAESLTAMLHDLRYALRTLRANPGFTTVAVLTLALGIGAATAIYSAVDGVLLRPLPFPHADRLVVPQSVRLGTDQRGIVTYRDFELWQQAGVFDGVAVYQLPEMDLTGAGDPVHTTAAFVTPDFFRVLGVRPLLGRLPQPDEFRPGADRPLVLSYGLWQRQFGGRPDVVGSTVRLSGTPVTVVGVLPRGLGWPREADIWYPLRYVSAPDDNFHEPDNFMFHAVARLRADRTMAQTRGQMATLAADVARAFPAKREGAGMTAVPMRDWLVGPTLTRALWVLLGAVGFVLLIACVNVANLLLARGAARGRELALRTALGAGRGRLVRQLLVESALLAAGGGVLGVALAAALTRGLVALAPAGLPRLDEVALDGSVLAVATGVTLLSALLFGLVPALHASASSPAAALAEDGGARTAGGVRTQRTGGVLVVAEVALALVLLTGAGLLGRSVLQLSRVDPGLDAAHVLTFQAALPGQTYDSTAKALRFWDALQRRLEALPGVEAASMSSALPVGGGGFHLGRTLIRTGAPRPPAGSEVGAMWVWASPNHFRTLGQPLLAGRDFDPRDDADAPSVMIVSRTFARTMFPDRSPAEVVGQSVTSWRDEDKPREIIGVVGDVRYNGVADTARTVVYVPLRQDYGGGSAAVSVRATGDPAILTAAVRRELAALDPSIAMARVETLDATLAGTMAPQRFNALLLGGFAVLAVLLAAVGLYGLLSYGVTQRARELSVRVALGATRGEVIRLVLGRSLRLLVIGTALGLAGSLALTRVLASLLFGVQPTDPLTFGAVTLLLLAVALLASYLPARRAARADPARALRAT
ncbi:MAG TPA: ABC transporter permease [Gemmatimonadaceae bacterium]|nr:ABC transporter permease [Gemmatimonadaceae bacterium]